MALELRVRAYSETGLVRKSNQDSGYASPAMMLVADGMGGAAAGDLASRIAVDELRQVDGQGDGEGMLDILEAATGRANQRLAELIAADPDLDGMGTTICGGLFDGSDLGVVHLGDSRLYLIRGAVMMRLTHDHTWVQSLIDDGRLSETAAFYHPHRSLLLRVLNGQPYSKPDLLLISLQDGDRLLFCSDGLCGLVDDSGIARGLCRPDPEEAMAELLEAAHQAGGSDNVTMILADVLDPKVINPSPPPDTAPTALLPSAAAVIAAASPTTAASPNTAFSPDTAASPTTPAGPSSAASPVEPESPVSPVSAQSPAEKEAAPRLITAQIRPQLIAAKPVLGKGRRLGGGLLLGAAAGRGPLTPGAPVAGLTAPPEEEVPAKKSWRFWLVVIGSIVLALAALIGGGFAYARSQYFVGADSSGHIAIYRGFPGDVLGVETNWLVESSKVLVTDLPKTWRQHVEEGLIIQEGGFDQARITVQQLYQLSLECLAQRQEREHPTPDPAPTPGAPEETATPQPTPSTTPAPVPDDGC